MNRLKSAQLSTLQVQLRSEKFLTKIIKGLSRGDEDEDGRPDG